MKSPKPDVVKSILALAISKYIQFLAKISASIVTASVLGPHLKGVWSAVSLVTSFSRYYDLGLISAMRRKLPILYVQNRYAEAEKLKNTVFTINVIVSLVVATFIITYASFRGDELELYLRTGLFVIAGVLILHRVALFSTDFLQANRRFVELSKINVLQVIVIAGLSVVLVFYISLYSLFVAEVVGWGLFCLLTIRKVQPSLVFSIDKKETIGHLKVGLPLTMLAFGWTMFQLCDRLVILNMLDVTSLGLYSISVLGVSVLQIAPDSIKNAIQPEILRIYAKNNKDTEKLKKFVYKPVYLVACLMAIMLGYGYLLIPEFISIVLPDYTDGIRPAQILLIGGYMIGVSLVSQQILTATKQFYRMMIAMSISIAVNIVFNILMISAGYGLIGVSISTSISYLLYALMINKLVMIDIYNVRLMEFIKYIFCSMLPIIYIMIFIFFVEWFYPQRSLNMVILALLSMSIYALPLLGYAYKVKNERRKGIS